MSVPFHLGKSHRRSPGVVASGYRRGRRCLRQVAKVHGSLAWHSHDHEDELFLVLRAGFGSRWRAKVSNSTKVRCSSMPKGVRHNPWPSRNAC